VLFFKELKKERLGDPGFKAVYDKECHICSLTLMVIEQMELRKKTKVLKHLKISPKDYGLLEKGDFCIPEQVLRLCRYLDIKTDDLPPCPRLESES